MALLNTQFFNYIKSNMDIKSCNYSIDKDPWCLICEAQLNHYINIKDVAGLSQYKYVKQVNGFSCLVLTFVGIFLLTNESLTKHPYRLIGICCLLEGYTFWSFREIKCNLIVNNGEIQMHKLGFITGFKSEQLDQILNLLQLYWSLIFSMLSVFG